MGGGGQVSRRVACANAPAVHFLPESFDIYAAPELAAHPLAVPGVCFNPGCSARFTPSRPWQVYCGRACRDAAEREFRRVGHMAAPALLAWRLGKYERDNAALRDLSRAGRRYIGGLQSAWLADRLRRAGE